jgi:hypothetical protein
MTRDDALERIRRLMNIDTARGATEAEAQTAMAHAQRLMDQHNIACAELTASGAEDPAFETGEIWSGQSFDSHYRMVMPILEAAYSVKAFFWKQTTPGPSGRRRLVSVSIKVFGDKANVDAAKWTLSYLAPTFRGLWDRYRARTGARTPEMVSYYMGIQHGLLERLKVTRAETAATLPGNGRALALVASKLEHSWADVARERGLKTISQKYHTGNAYAAGKRDSDSISLRRSVNGAPQKALDY